MHALLCYDFHDHHLQPRRHQDKCMLLHTFFSLKVHLFLLILKTFSCPPKRTVGRGHPRAMPSGPPGRGGADGVHWGSPEAGAKSSSTHHVFCRGENKPLEDALPLPQLTPPFTEAWPGPPNNEHSPMTMKVMTMKTIMREALPQRFPCREIALGKMSPVHRT